MTGDDHPRLPLVYAQSAAVAEARRLAPTVVIENAVRAAIQRRALRRDRPNGTATVFLADGLEASVRRSQSPLTGCRSWLVTGVRRGGRSCG
jgi:hypothetical protein